MRTSQALESITNAGDFEILAIRVLRELYDECQAIEHLGVNAEGKTVPAPVDGFIPVPGSVPPLYVMAAFTTSEQLAEKWMFDHRTSSRSNATAIDDGDLVKAIANAYRIRENQPDATFSVFLCTNRQPKQKDLESASGLGFAHGVTVHFLTRSRLRDFLDVNPTGQYLRKLHLGIDVELISKELLHDASRACLSAYGREFFLINAQSFQATSSSQELAQRVDERIAALHLVRGGSGMGKSAMCYLLLASHVERGMGLWIPGPIAESSVSLSDAVAAVLRAYFPSVPATAGQDALALATPDNPLILVVDDVNRAANPIGTIRKIVAWTNPGDHSTAASNSPSSSTILVVPIWETIWDRLDYGTRFPSWVSPLTAERWNAEESRMMLRTHAKNLKGRDIREVAERFNGDPILLAMFATSGACSKNALDTIDQYVARMAAEVGGGHWSRGEVVSALRAVAELMLRRRTLYPAWSDLTMWLSGEQREPVRAATQHAALCRITGPVDSERFDFRHDRILGHFLAEAVRPMLRHPAENAQILADPFFAPYVALAYSLDGDAEMCSWFMRECPLVLVEAIRFVGVESPIYPLVIHAATTWLNLDAPKDSALQFAQWAASRSLLSTESPAVLEITELRRTHRFFTWARIANGDSKVAILDLGDLDPYDLEVNYQQRRELLERAVDRYRKEFMEACCDVFQDPHANDKKIWGALVLAGFVQDADLTLLAAQSWGHCSDPGKLFKPAFWACLRCGGSEIDTALRPLIEYWAALPEELVEGNSLRSPRFDLTCYLRFTMGLGLPEASVHALSRFTKACPDLSFAIGYMLDHLYTPAAIKIVVRVAAEQMETAKSNGGYSMWASDLQRRWKGNDWDDRALPEELIDEVHEIADDVSQPEWLRSGALWLWVNCSSDLKALSLVPKDCKAYSGSVWRRLSLGDKSVVDEAVKDRERLHLSWYQFSHVWCNEIYTVVAGDLDSLARETRENPSEGRTNRHYDLSRLLMNIDPSTSRELLLNRWNDLRSSPLFFQLALYLGGPELLKQAGEFFKGSSAPSYLLEHFFSFGGFNISSKCNKLYAHHFEAFRPYLEWISVMDLERIVGAARRAGLREWPEVHIRPVLEKRLQALDEGSEERLRVQRIIAFDLGTDEEIAQSLDFKDFRRDLSTGLHVWAMRFEQRQDSPDRFAQVLKVWAASGRSLHHLDVLSRLLVERGRRRDLHLLEGDWEGEAGQAQDLISKAKFAVMYRTLE